MILRISASQEGHLHFITVELMLDIYYKPHVMLNSSLRFCADLLLLTIKSWHY
jgi:hypothetical protein